MGKCPGICMAMRGVTSMELLMETKSADFLREVFCVPVSQEETGETIVPDSLPDVGRILQAGGTS